MSKRKQFDQQLENAYLEYERGHHRSAEKMYDQLRQSLRFYHNRAQRINLLMGMSYVKSALKKHDEARACCDKLRQHSRPRKGLYIALHQSALIEKEAGEWRKALEYLHEELANLKRYHKKEPQKHAICLHEQAHAFRALGLKQEALYAMEEAANKAEVSMDETTCGYIYRSLGDLQREAGNVDAARQSYEKARDYFLEAEDAASVKEMNELLKQVKTALPDKA